jgi:hypothetical protein
MGESMTLPVTTRLWESLAGSPADYWRFALALLTVTLAGFGFVRFIDWEMPQETWGPGSIVSLAMLLALACSPGRTLALIWVCAAFVLAGWCDNRRYGVPLDLWSFCFSAGVLLLRHAWARVGGVGAGAAEAATALAVVLLTGATVYGGTFMSGIVCIEFAMDVPFWYTILAYSGFSDLTLFAILLAWHFIFAGGPALWRMRKGQIIKLHLTSSVN